MAVHSYSIAKGGSYLKASGVVDAAHTGAAESAAVQATEATLTAAVAAAQAIGAGDASAEVDAVDVAWVATLAALDLYQAATAAPAAVQVIIDLSSITKKSDALRSLEQIISYIKSRNWPPA
jgi:hypothetical protein